MGKRGFQAGGWVQPVRKRKSKVTDGPTIKERLARPRPTLEEVQALVRQQENGSSALAAYESQMNSEYRAAAAKDRELKLGKKRKRSSSRSGGSGRRKRSGSRSRSTGEKKRKRKHRRRRSPSYSSSRSPSLSRSPRKKIERSPSPSSQRDRMKRGRSPSQRERRAHKKEGGDFDDVHRYFPGMVDVEPGEIIETRPPPVPRESVSRSRSRERLFDGTLSHANYGQGASLSYAVSNGRPPCEEAEAKAGEDAGEKSVTRAATVTKSDEESLEPKEVTDDIIGVGDSAGNSVRDCHSPSKQTPRGEESYKTESSPTRHHSRSRERLSRSRSSKGKRHKHGDRSFSSNSRSNSRRRHRRSRSREKRRHRRHRRRSWSSDSSRDSDSSSSRERHSRRKRKRRKRSRSRSSNRRHKKSRTEPAPKKKNGPIRLSEFLAMP